jgi:hypothetical protein
MTIWEVERRAVKKIRGSVTNTFGQPVSDANVEVWNMPPDVPDRDFNFSSVRLDDDERIGDIQVTEDGKFYFSGPGPGRYIVCASAAGFNTKCVLVKVKAKSKRKDFKIELEVRT